MSQGVTRGALPLEEVRVKAGGGLRDYTVFLGTGALAALPRLLTEVGPSRWAIISDSTVAPLHGTPLMSRLEAASLDVALLTFPAGEENKNRETWMQLTDALLESGYGRDSGIVALGGGVTGDLAGFVAATLLRGVPVVQVPSSMLAMLDASVGGKTGVDTATGKNLVGAFHPPALVLVDPDLLRTLPLPQRAQGLVEAFKHGLILDERYLARLLERLPDLMSADPGSCREAIQRSVTLKAEVVSRDEQEGGFREILNFGHTFGHALEAASNYALPHGSAVATGMILEARLGERLGITEHGVAEVVEDSVRALALPGLAGAPPEAATVADFLVTDKKRRKGQTRFVLLQRVGEVESEGGWSHVVEEALIDEVLREGLKAGRLPGLQAT